MLDRIVRELAEEREEFTHRLPAAREDNEAGRERASSGPSIPAFAGVAGGAFA
jgi:hypothetical protein